MTVSIGDRLRLSVRQSYLKTADPMPMLRPPDLVEPGEVGEGGPSRPLLFVFDVERFFSPWISWNSWRPQTDYAPSNAPSVSGCCRVRRD